jgi:large subunit ribosomal protein L13
MKTTLAKESEVQRAWHVLDADGQPVGRLAVKIAKLLRGKDKPAFAPHLDLGDFVVILNAAKVKLTGNKETKKIYTSYSLYPGGFKQKTAAQVRAKHPEFLIEHAVRDMLPRNRLARQLIKRLKVYAGTEHPHTAQKPQALAV